MIFFFYYFYRWSDFEYLIELMSFTVDLNYFKIDDIEKIHQLGLHYVTIIDPYICKNTNSKRQDLN